jgi:hypothetical protein
MPKIIRIYSKKYRARIAGSEAPIADQPAFTSTNTTRAQGHEHWALQALAEEMARRHATARQTEALRAEPVDAPPPPGKGSRT